MLEKITEIPRQAIPESQKTKDWHKQSMDAHIEMSRLNGEIRKEDLRGLYEYYNGVINEMDYSYVLDPYGSKKSLREAFPSRIRNYPIIKPVIDLLLGEKVKRPFNFSVTATNSDAFSIKEQRKMKFMKENLEERFAAELSNLMGLNVPVNEEKAKLPADAEKLFERNYKDNRAIIGQKSLNYVVKDVRMKEKLRLMWFHYLVSGEFYSHKYISHGEVKYEVMNPIDVDYDKDPDVEFVEDGDWALYRKLAHASTIIDHYHDQLTKEQVIRLENPRQITGTPFSLYNTRPSSSQNIHNSERNRLIEWIQIYWKSRKKVGFLTYFSEETGGYEEMVVDETYKPQEGESIEWVWINEIRKGARVDGDIYLDMGPLYNTRTSIENPSLGKLPINGRKYSNINAENVSLVKIGVPYQINYNVYKYRLELAIAKSKDVIAMLDINMIPKKWDMDKFMYHLDSTNIAWIDYAKEGIRLNPQHQNILDLTIKTIDSYVALLESIVLEWERVSGVNRQRQGDIGPYDSVSGSQQSIIQSSHITEDLYNKFEELENRDLQGLLDLSKEAWIEGKDIANILPDGSVEFLQMDPVEHAASEYGTFVSSSGKEQEKIQNARVMGQAMIQNGVPSSAVLEMWDSESFSELKHQIKKAEEAAAQQAAAIEEAAAKREGERRMAEIQAEIQKEAPKVATENRKIEADILMKQMDINNQREGEMSDEEKNKLKAEIEKVKADIRQADEALKLQAQKQKDDKELGLKKIQVDKIKAKSTPKPTSSTTKKKK